MGARKSDPCSRGCGRRAYTASGVCWSCATGRAAPEPKVELLSDSYLARCVEEAIRREDERKREVEEGRARLSAAVVRLVQARTA